MGHLRVITNQDPDFYSLMGPYLSRREIVKELGFPVYDDDGKRWTVAVDDSGCVLGFGGLVEKSGRATLTSDYVLPEHRRRGVYRQILEERIRFAQEQCLDPIMVMATRSAAGILEQYGFQAERETVQYVKMTLALRDPSSSPSSYS